MDVNPSYMLSFICIQDCCYKAKVVRLSVTKVRDIIKFTKEMRRNKVCTVSRCDMGINGTGKEYTNSIPIY